jgi:uncharacterized iron-regulated membrane protein
MEPALRASMNWLHTWAGVILGGLLFAIFWMGTLAVFDKEIDRWMAPMTRLGLPERPPSLEPLRSFYDRAAIAKSSTWQLRMPTEREPFVRLAWRERSGQVVVFADPQNLTPLPDPGTWAGSRFIYPFHYDLHLDFMNLGIWIVGAASMAMLLLCVSGVIIHRRIFADFFALRVGRKARRTILDLHNVAGVLGFPFHIAITLSGLIIFYMIYFPSGWLLTYPSRAEFQADVFGRYQRPKLDRPGRLHSLDSLVTAAETIWGGEQPKTLLIRNPGDANAYAQFERPFDNRVARAGEYVFLDATTGDLLMHQAGYRPLKEIQRVVMGFHLVHFRHWSLRWGYFALGLLGCILIATGYLFWLESRRRKHEQLGLRGVRVVDALTVGSVAGIIAATLSFFVVNRLLPLGATFASYDRAALEIWTFYLVWLATFAHAWLRPAQAWIEQCRAVAVLAILAVGLNWITTGDHLARSVMHRHLWPIAGMDLLLLAGAVIAGLAAHRLRGVRTGSGASSIRHRAGR